MKVPLLDLVVQYQALKPEIDAAVAEVMASQYFIMGPKVVACEKEIASYCECAHAVGVSSGTDALLISLMAEQIGPGDEVITTPYTFFATGGSIARTGAKPVFVDILPETFNINPALIEEQISPNTRAIIPVHLYGQLADMNSILAIARKRGLAVIEDAAQAIGSADKGKRAGSIGDYGCFSFFPSKNLGAAGDGGMVTTNDPARGEKLAKLRNHGAKPKYYHALIGGNFRLDALQAAIVSVKLKHLDSWSEKRQANAARYDRLILEAGLEEKGIVRPSVRTDRHIFNQYVIRVPNRDELRSSLAGKDIGTEVYYPVPLHRQECFAYLGYKEGDCPESEKAANETLALPIYPEISDDQAAYVVESISEFLST